MHGVKIEQFYLPPLMLSITIKYSGIIKWFHVVNGLIWSQYDIVGYLQFR